MDENEQLYFDKFTEGKTNRRSEIAVFDEQPDHEDQSDKRRKPWLIREFAEPRLGEADW